MAECAKIRDQLPFYAAGTLSPAQRTAVARHLAACAECRAELALWAAVDEQVTEENRTLPAPSPAVLSSTLAQVRTQRSRVSAPTRLWQLLWSQLPLLRKEIWPASAIVMLAGALLSLSAGGDGTPILTLMAPLVAAAGVAMIYGPENDPGLELALATPTSPRQVLLARLVLVFGYDLALAVAGSVSLIALGASTYGLGELVLSWLGPMTLLSTLALTLSLWIGAGNGATVAFLLWLARWQVPALAEGDIGTLKGSAIVALITVVEGFSRSPTIQFSLAGVLLCLALRLAGRSDLSTQATWH